MMDGTMRYGAVTAKVRAMYGLRLRRDDYTKMAAMKSVSEIAGFLREHPGWGTALQSIDTTALHRDRLESILRKHSLSHYLKLLLYMRRDDKAVLRYPLLVAEMEQIMRFMRLASAGRVSEYVYDIPEVFRRQSRIQFDSLSMSETYDDMLKAVSSTGFYASLQRIRPANGEFPSYLLVETQMRRYYYRSLKEFLRNRKDRSGELLREAVGIQADWDNITLIERILQYYPSLMPDIFSYLLPAGAHLRTVEIKTMIGMSDGGDLRGLLKHTFYGQYMEGRENMSLEKLGQWILMSFYRRHMAGGEPSVLMPISYINLYGNELRNLIHTIEGVRYGLAPELTERYLVLL